MADVSQHQADSLDKPSLYNGTNYSSSGCTLPPEILLAVLSWTDAQTVCKLARTTPSIAKLCTEHSEYLKKRIVSQQLGLVSSIFKSEQDLLGLFSTWNGHGQSYPRPFGDSNGYLLFLEHVRLMTTDVVKYLLWRLNWQWAPSSQSYLSLFDAVLCLWPLMHGLARLEQTQAAWDYFATLSKARQAQCAQSLFVIGEAVLDSHIVPWDAHVPRHVVNILTHHANRRRLGLVYLLYTFNSIREGMLALWHHRMHASPPMNDGSDAPPAFDFDAAFFGANERGGIEVEGGGNLCHSLFGYKTYFVSWRARGVVLPCEGISMLVPGTEQGGPWCGDLLNAMMIALKRKEGIPLNWRHYCAMNTPYATGDYLTYEDGFEDDREGEWATAKAWV